MGLKLVQKIQNSDCVGITQFQKSDNSDEPIRRKVEKTSFFSLFMRIKGDQMGLKTDQKHSKLAMCRYYLDRLYFQKSDNSNEQI